MADDKYIIQVEAKTDEAKKKLTEVAKATENVGKAAKATGTEAKTLSGVVGQAAEAASSMGGAFGGAGRAVSLFSASLRALKMALAGATGGISLLIGAIGAALAAVINLFQRHKEELKAFEEAQRQCAQSTEASLQRLNQARLEGLSKSYAEANNAATAMLSTTERLAAAHRQWVEANLQWNLSMLDKAEQEALSGAVGDSRAQEDIKARYAQERARVSGEAALQNAQNDLTNANTTLEAAKDRRNAKSGQLADTQQTLDEALARRDLLIRRLDSNAYDLNRGIGDKGQKMEEKGRLEGAYKATLDEIKALEAALPKLRQELDALTSELSVAETGVTVATLNLETTQNKNATTPKTFANAQAERTTQRKRADAEAAAREKAKQEAEEAKAAARAKRIQEAAAAAKEAGDVAALQDEAATLRAGLDARARDVQSARSAHAAALQRRSKNNARMGSMYGGSFTAAQDEGAILRSAQSMQRAEEAFNQAAEAAEKFFKTFDAALKREQGEADRAAQRAKAARETN